MENKIKKIFKGVTSNSYLIHSITNHISINDCANIILCLNSTPFMAEHSSEVSEVTNKSDALVLNIGNINDERMKSIFLSGRKAKEIGIPIILDPVGISATSLREKLVFKILDDFMPSVIRGNLSEILKILGLDSNPRGIDASKKDLASIDDAIFESKKFTKKNNNIIVISGKEDIVISKDGGFILENGVPQMSKVTGTGCMLSCILGVFSAYELSISSIITGISMFNISSELSKKYMEKNQGGLGSFKIKLFDYMSQFEESYFDEYLKFRRI